MKAILVCATPHLWKHKHLFDFLQIIYKAASYKIEGTEEIDDSEDGDPNDHEDGEGDDDEESSES